MKNYNDPHYLVRKLKPYIPVNANTNSILINQNTVLHSKAEKYIELLCTRYNYQIQHVIDVPNYKLMYLRKSVALVGKKIIFLDCKVFKIAPGAMVTQIGTGAITASNCIDKFTQPYYYAGAIIIDQIKYFAFKIPPELAPDKLQDYYFLYTKDKYCMFRNIYNRKNKIEYTRRITGIIK